MYFTFLIQSLAKAVSDKDEELICEHFDPLNDWIGALPSFFQPHASAIVDIVSKIAGSDEMYVDIVRMAMEFLVIFIEEGRALARSLDKLAPLTIKLGFKSFKAFFTIGRLASQPTRESS